MRVVVHVIVHPHTKGLPEGLKGTMPDESVDQECVVLTEDLLRRLVKEAGVVGEGVGGVSLCVCA